MLVSVGLLVATLSHYSASLPPVFAGPRLRAVNLRVSCDHECKLRALWPGLTTFLTLPGGTRDIYENPQLAGYKLFLLRLRAAHIFVLIVKVAV